jgi:hypothetical protein
MLLNAGLREMAASLVGIHWTQNFGSGTDFEEEFNAWRN